MTKFERHEASVYKDKDGRFEIICQSRGCRFRLSADDLRPLTGGEATYQHAQAEADRHSVARFR
jgi:hypothetical protein